MLTATSRENSNPDSFETLPSGPEVTLPSIPAVQFITSHSFINSLLASPCFPPSVLEEIKGFYAREHSEVDQKLNKTRMGRTPFYILTLFTAILQSLFGTLAGFVNGRSPFLYIFGKLAGALSVATWVWVAILLRYSCRPESTNPLCRSYAHFTSFLILSVVWIAIGIMIATQMPWECGAEMLWCAAASFSSALAFCTGFSALGACIVIYRNAAASGAGLAINVAQVHNKRSISGPDFESH